MRITIMRMQLTRQATSCFESRMVSAPIKKANEKDANGATSKEKIPTKFPKDQSHVGTDKWMGVGSADVPRFPVNSRSTTIF